jgi:hypothetical protein
LDISAVACWILDIDPGLIVILRKKSISEDI